LNWIETCRKLISFDSSPTSSTDESVQYLAELASVAGLVVEVMQEVQNGVAQSNIIISTEEIKPGDQQFLLQKQL
jgi:hypothetical protein